MHITLSIFQGCFDLRKLNILTVLLNDQLKKRENVTVIWTAKRFGVARQHSMWAGKGTRSNHHNVIKERNTFQYTIIFGLFSAINIEDESLQRFTVSICHNFSRCYYSS